MPEPNPFGIADYETINGRVLIGHRWRIGRVGGNERRNRFARMGAIARNISRDGWTCRHCGDDISFTKRADAIYCTARCRSAAWRASRAEFPDTQKKARAEINEPVREAKEIERMISGE